MTALQLIDFLEAKANLLLLLMVSNTREEHICQH